MTEPAKPSPKLPPRMSAPKPEDAKPSRLIEAFWWVVFLVPLGFTYWATQSIVIVVILVGIRVLMMLVPKFTKKKVSVKVEEKAAPIEANVITSQNVSNPYIEEAKAEWYGLLRFLRIYDKDKEDANLAAYRKLRGWD